MTAQIGETLHFNGSEHTMCSEPLNDYFAFGGEKPAPQPTWQPFCASWVDTATR
ncbi:MAG: hypothetical protein KDJ64_10935 [Nitratireductor sp.]|nr:hypothetical protein [Nitratireductor sp.]